MISTARMSTLYPRGVLRNLPCACIPQTGVRGGGVFFFLTSPFLLLARGLLTSLPFPLGLAAQRTSPFSELALNAKLAFSILHKVHGTMATCLGEEPQLPSAAFGFLGAMAQGDGQRSVYGLAQLPIIKLSLIAAYLWFLLTAPAPSQHGYCAKGKAELCLPLPTQHRHGFVSVSFIIKH